MEKKENIAGGLLLIGTIAAIAFGFKKKSKSGDTIAENTPNLAPKRASNTGTNQSFPLQPGSRGANVRLLQSALLKVGGRAAEFIKNTGGADGIYGNGTRSALLAAGYPTTISKALFQQIISVQSKTENAFSKIENYLFVDSIFSTPIFINVTSFGSAYLPEFPIIDLPNETYLGQPTGEVRGKYIEVQTSVNKVPFRFWVERANTETFTGNAMDFDSFRRGRKRKTTAQINTIVNALN
ncbi:MAG: hypothetical protein AAGI07_00255 [Bacteroidota bacterium]